MADQTYPHAHPHTHPQTQPTTAAAVQVVTEDLRLWIIAQAEAGCLPAEVLGAMCTSGWDEDVAIAAMEETLSAHLQRRQKAAEQATNLAANLAADPDSAIAPPQTALPQTAPPQAVPCGVPVPDADLARSPPTVVAAGRRVRVLSTLRSPRVVVFGGLLSDDECVGLMGLARPRLSRSETVDNDTGGSEVNAARTSEGMFFERGEAPLIARIEQRIAALLRWPLENGEGLQILRYRPGAEYRPHHDYFDLKHPGTAKILQRGGQRVATLVMYLNTPDAGGGTTFPDVGLEVAPQRGNAVFFSYDRADASTRTLHGGAPVLAGEKWVATKWLREGAFT